MRVSFTTKSGKKVSFSARPKTGYNSKRYNQEHYRGMPNRPRFSGRAAEYVQEYHSRKTSATRKRIIEEKFQLMFGYGKTRLGIPAWKQALMKIKSIHTRAEDVRG